MPEAEELEAQPAVVTRQSSPLEGSRAGSQAHTARVSTACPMDSKRQNELAAAGPSIQTGYKTDVRAPCFRCKQFVIHVKRCSKCRVAQYCSRECQKKHWKEGGHKQQCKRLREERKCVGDGSDSVILDVAGHDNRATRFCAKGDFKAAANEYRTALKLAPKHPTLWENLGCALSAMGDYDRALAAFKVAVANFHPMASKESMAILRANIAHAMSKRGDLDLP